MKRASLLLVVLFSTAFAQAPALKVRIEDLMTKSEFRAAGLEKLSPDELTNLNEFLSTYTGRVVRATSHANDDSGGSEAIESQIAGEFKGWTGETIFKLTNGQIWQQTEYDYTYEYAYMPNVTIYKTSSCWKMKVEEVEDTICVKRLK
jgi:hypothetical protein